MIDSVEIQTANLGFSTVASSKKCPQIIATTTNYGTVLQYCFQLRIVSVHVIYAITANAKTTFLLVCHSNKMC